MFVDAVRVMLSMKELTALTKGDCVVQSDVKA